MERSKEELLAGLKSLKPDEPFPDEVFYEIFEIPDNVERTKYIEDLRRVATANLKRGKEFDRIFKSYVKDYNQRMRQTGLKTHFTGQPLELDCGEWEADDFGVRRESLGKEMVPIRYAACTHPLLPTQILKNVDTQEERITLAYYKAAVWQTITVDRAVCANANKIVDALSRFGIEVTSDNAKHLVRYISDCVGYNPKTLEPKKSINRLGWAGGEFMPYAQDIVFDGGADYSSLFSNVREAGNFSEWKKLCGDLRKDRIVRLAFGASLGSVLIEPLNLLSFILHIWGGESGSGKTVAIMAAMSIWGNPRIGALVKTLDGTKVGLIRNAAFLYSLPLAGDELQTLMKEYTGNFDQLIYRLTEGIDRMRGRASGGVEETKTWRNSFLFSGEEPITKANSRAGSKNRVIEVEADHKIIENGNKVVAFLTENHGHAGPLLIEYLRNADTKELSCRYDGYFSALCALDTTEKQAMSMACIMLADAILVEQIFTDEVPLSIGDVKEYLKSASEVDVAERAYQSVLNWIAKNPLRFEDPTGDNPKNRGEVWGKILEDEDRPEIPPVAVINKDVLCKFLEAEGYDYSALTKKWDSKGRLIRNSQGKFIHCTKVYGIKSSYIKLNLLQDAGNTAPNTDENGFMQVEEDEKLPFE